MSCWTRPRVWPFDEGAISKMDYASFLAAGLMYVLVNQRDSVGLMTFDSALRRRFAPAGTSEGLRPMLESLESIQPAGKSDIEAAIHETAALVGPKCLVIVISDFLQDVDKILRGIRHLSHDGHNVMVLHVLDRGERKLSFGGVAELRDMESQARLVVEVDEIKAAYEASVAHHLETLRSGCTDCLATYHLMETTHPVESAFSKVGSG